MSLTLDVGATSEAVAPLSGIDKNLQKEILQPKLYLNGFPKSGLHLAVLMGLCLTAGAAHENPWAGTFQRNGWSSDWMPDWRIWKHVSRLREGHMMKGHAGYRKDIEQFLCRMGAAVVFVYRDLRDVVVSQSYHAIADNDDNFSHPDKELYRKLPNQEERIRACIEGIGPYQGIMHRWEQYEGWLNVPWVFKMRYEDMRNKPRETAVQLIKYVYWRTGQSNGLAIQLPQETVETAADMMVEMMGHNELSPTYRKGKTGGWRKEFTPELITLFKQHDRNNTLVNLGYEDSKDWQ